jgi:hypothetical protein
VTTPRELRPLEKAVSEAIRRECPQVKGLANHAILGPPVMVLIRSFGHAQTETWTALPWERFEGLIPA